MPRLTLVLTAALAVGLGACDSAVEPPTTPTVPTTPTPPAAATVTVAQPLDSTAAYASDYVGEATTVPLAGRFEANATAGTLSYEATSDAPGVVSASVESGALVLRRLSTGRARVHVTARGSSGGEATASVTVEAKDPCPPGPAAGQADFLPLEVGRVWTYNGRTEQYTSAGSWYIVGTYAYTTQSVTCRRGVRTATFGVHSRTRYQHSDPNDPASYTEGNGTARITETAEGVSMNPFWMDVWPSEGMRRYHPSSSPEVYWSGAGGRGVTQVRGMAPRHPTKYVGTHGASGTLTLESES